MHAVKKIKGNDLTKVIKGYRSFIINTNFLNGLTRPYHCSDLTCML
jgi:hypothetical protein